MRKRELIALLLCVLVVAVSVLFLFLAVRGLVCGILMFLFCSEMGPAL